MYSKPAAFTQSYPIADALILATKFNLIMVRTTKVRSILWVVDPFDYLGPKGNFLYPGDNYKL